jgi:hypothetical protein
LSAEALSASMIARQLKVGSVGAPRTIDHAAAPALREYRKPSSFGSPPLRLPGVTSSHDALAAPQGPSSHRAGATARVAATANGHNQPRDHWRHHVRARTKAGLTPSASPSVKSPAAGHRLVKGTLRTAATADGALVIRADATRREQLEVQEDVAMGNCGVQLRRNGNLAWWATPAATRARAAALRSPGPESRAPPKEAPRGHASSRRARTRSNTGHDPPPDTRATRRPGRGSTAHRRHRWPAMPPLTGDPLPAWRYAGRGREAARQGGRGRRRRPGLPAGPAAHASGPSATPARARARLEGGHGRLRSGRSAHRRRSAAAARGRRAKRGVRQAAGRPAARESRSDARGGDACDCLLRGLARALTCRR